ncbi:MAG: hypothetical protein L0J01_03775 [Tetragenococcus halophilus]|nr:hypothetical protein [Tetragenococcus osmophilus]MCF1601493.1 hypothetical protein [Tetragenococcus halophilus]MCF1675666.1 hypothetical protein [Tetragenococcus halophilus]MCF1684697.1 hypothetical protein [Tetragenococcus halophilus]MCO7026501.1 hypothetical protein [Tetragenococcus halophilus]MDN6112504.1 hypothetical protein [Tetragenococcus halophilus]
MGLVIALVNHWLDD